MSQTDRFGLPVGAPVATELPRPRPPSAPMAGRFCSLRPALPEDAEELFAAYAEEDGRNWTYLPQEKPRDLGEMRARLETMAASEDPLYHSVLDAEGRAVGTCSYLRITPEAASLEVGWISFSPRLQRTVMSTEAMHLMMARAFDELGYRRYEWKCDALNAPSRAAAARLGFTYEGTHRQATVVKGRNRDTAWFSVLDSEWPVLRAAFAGWLAPENFDAEGRQIARLESFRAG
ncbi:GNAT family N-acetyltransferase [Roseivivax sp. GX 12232]|uniref:GNAT family N-acetyltransferase n=1 Tax=Roseivivax sp. GX 12232 TaxID=2900547 RepID=UPI001E4CE8B3|nr:GNAT family protein [Roseivivax sp. GX 12232]MCE0507113.1 GNAT family N-acetyltransferase [Roseivivax sp. GX 12232]